jgi:hypothetical protein
MVPLAALAVPRRQIIWKPWHYHPGRRQGVGSVAPSRRSGRPKAQNPRQEKPALGSAVQPAATQPGRVPKWLIGTFKLVVAPTLVFALGGWLVFFRIIPGTPGGSDVTPKPGTVSGLQNSPAASVLPFTVATRGQTYFQCGPGWMVAQPASAVLPPSRYSDYDHWMTATNAVISDYGAVLLTVQGRTAAEVVLTSLQVLVVNRAAAVGGTHVHEQCGGPGAARELDVNLDHDPPTYRPIARPDLLDNNGPAWQKAPLVFPYKVSLTDAETFLILANTFKCDCQWRIKLDWASQGATGTTLIDDHGKPFRTTGDHNATADCTTENGLTCGPPTPLPGITP